MSAASSSERSTDEHRPSGAPASTTAYDALIELLEAHDADYEILSHDPVGTTEVVSRLRGHPAEQAAKCLVLVVKLDRRTRRHVLAVVPGDSKVDLPAVAHLFGARYVGFADPATAERLAGSEPGTVLPFAMHPDIELVVDPRVLAQPRLYFNAARLDQSISLDAADYAAIAHPSTAPIARTQRVSPEEGA